MVTVDFDRVRIGPGARILDIGCGQGRHTCAAYCLKEVFVIGADLSFDDAITLQERGVGAKGYKKLGCGLFIPHKTV